MLRRTDACEYILEWSLKHDPCSWSWHSEREKVPTVSQTPTAATRFPAEGATLPICARGIGVFQVIGGLAAKARDVALAAQRLRAALDHAADGKMA